MAVITRTATVAWTGDVPTGSGSLTTQSTALVDSPLSFPRRVGTPDGATSPEELLAAAHAGCYAMSLAGACASAGHKGAQLKVSAEVGLEKVQSTWHIVFSRVSVTAENIDVDDDAFQALLTAADESCPFSNLLRATAEVSITGSRATPAA